MAGIYIHIPYCKKRCNYCDFYKTTNISTKNDFLGALQNEIKQRSEFLVQNTIDTIYFGGGTPSVLNAKELTLIFDTINKYASVSKVAEITIEANPDDFSDEWGRSLKNDTPVNRISFGLQSMYDQQLRVMGRRHNSYEGFDAIDRASLLGFKNITADLIYGLPGLTSEMWSDTLDKTLLLPINHLSSYHLTYEEGTPFYQDKKRGLLTEIEEEESLKQFEILLSKTKEKGFDQYEISNFAKKGFESKHNSNYWTGSPYIGYGPSAHSFMGIERRWNVSNVNVYIEKVNTEKAYFEAESLTILDQYNELLMLGFRTSQGVFVEKIKHLDDALFNRFESDIKPLINSGELEYDDGYLKISTSSKFLTDGIIQKLFVV